MASKKIKTGDNVVIKFEKRYQRLSISSHKVYQVERLNSDKTCLLKGQDKSYPIDLFEKF